MALIFGAVRRDDDIMDDVLGANGAGPPPKVGKLSLFISGAFLDGMDDEYAALEISGPVATAEKFGAPFRPDAGFLAFLTPRPSCAYLLEADLVPGPNDGNSS